MGITCDYVIILYMRMDVNLFMIPNVRENRGIVLLAGGISRRMGQDKWMLIAGEMTVMERIISVLHPLGAELWVIAASAAELKNPHKFPDLSKRFPGVHMTHDTLQDIGPLAGIAAGLSNCVQDYLLVSASDMPFPSNTLAEMLFDLCIVEDAQAAIPQWNGSLHPLFAVYRKDCLASLTSFLEGGGRKVMDWLQTLDIAILAEKQIKQLDPQGIALFNMNHREDYALALKLLQDKNHLQE
jgi:molybdopterin-guanine dinucleotide biosynthesis protein A